jgi:hypothetical protein
MNVHAAQ